MRAAKHLPDNSAEGDIEVAWPVDHDCISRSRGLREVAGQTIVASPNPQGRSSKGSSRKKLSLPVLQRDASRREVARRCQEKAQSARQVVTL